MKFNKKLTALIGGAVCLGFMSVSMAASKLKPFVLASESAGDVASVTAATKSKLTGAGFTVVGEYDPASGAHIIAVTNDALKAAAAKSEFGAYGAAVRVGVTKAGGKVQVTYSNPTYWAAGFRMKSNLASVGKSLEGALGKVKGFGSAKGMKAKSIKKYHYMFRMPYFDDPHKLGKASNYKDAVKKVESALNAGKGGVKKVYRIDIPGTKSTVFGVNFTTGDASDANVIGKIDLGKIKHTAHFPYEIVVVGKKIYTLSGKFRIALSFPDLSMAGDGSFASIMSVPGAIESAGEKVAD